MSEAKENKRKRKREKKERTGKVWGDYEDRKLLEEFKEGKSLEEIAKAHERTEHAIKTRSVRILGALLKEGSSFEQALEVVKLNKQELAEFLITGKCFKLKSDDD